MRTEIKKINGLKRLLRVEVNEPTLIKDKESLYRELSKDLKVPGFRPGNAPIEVLEKYHKKVLQEEFLKRSIPSYYSKALEDNELEAVSIPRIYNVEFSSKRLVFDAEFEVKPDFELKDEDYKDLRVKLKNVVVEAIEIEKFITQLKEDIKKITAKDYPDEEIARWAGWPDVEALKEAIRAEIFIDKLRAKRATLENYVLEELLKRVKIEVPNSLKEEQHKKLIQQEIYNLRARGVGEEDIKKHQDDIKDKLKPLAEKQVKLYYILEAIAKKESLKTDPGNMFGAVIGYILSCAQYIT